MSVTTPVDPRVETLLLLRSIDVTMKAILLVLSEKRNDEPTADIAPDADLDGAYGDPIAKAKDPKDWTGETIGGTGRRFSECPPEYLDMLAARFDYFAGRETDEKKARYCRLDARRARGWAARIRAGKVAAPAPVAQQPAGDGWESGFYEDGEQPKW